MVRSLTNRGMPKPFALVVSVLLVLYFVPFAASPAGAVTPAFEIDGNQTHESQEDWEDLTVGTMADSGTKTNRVLTTFVDNVNDQGSDTTVFGSNNKEDAPGGVQWPNWDPSDNGNATGKSDFGRIALYSYVDGDNVFLVLGFDRGSNVQGNATANYYFELNQAEPQDGTDPNPVRTVGDVRINLNDDGNQNFTASVETWDGDSWAAATGVGDYEIASNLEAISDLASWWLPSLNAPGGTIDREGFIEASFDLTSFGVVLGCPSQGFKALNGRSTTGESEKNLVDYFAAQPISIPSTCASIFLYKFQADGTTPLGGATFKIEPNPLPEGTAGKPTDNFLTIFDDSGDNTDKEGTTNYDDPDGTAGVITLAAVVPGTYTVTEIAAPDGWIGSTAVVTVTPEQFGTSPDSTGDGKNVASFTNALGSVKFFKSYAGGGNATGATFLLERDGSDEDAAYDDGSVTVTDNGTNDANSTMGVIKVNNLLTGSWRITEQSAPTGWVPDGDTVTFTISAATPNPELGNPTFENPRRTYPLSVLKVGVAPGEAIDGSNIAGAVFKLWRDDNGLAGLQTTDPDGTGSQVADSSTGTCTTGADGACAVTGQAWAFDYYWEEISVPAPWNLPSVTVQGPVRLNADSSTNPASATKFSDTKSKIVTKATNSGLPNAVITDTATLSGLNSRAAGTVTFDLYGPFTTDPTPTSCTAATKVNTTPIAATRAVNGNGDYTSVPVAITTAGFYAWIAHYSGDGNGNRAVSGACDDEGETSYVAGPGVLEIVKAVTPVAAPGVVISVGDTLTYTLTVTASGEPNQPNVVVTDYVPGFDPARPDSGSTTYVAGSASCVGTGTCNVTEPGADGLITWGLGEMATGTTRQVTFQVIIDALPDGIVSVDIVNAGAVRSDRLPAVESNEVITPVTQVLGVKVAQPEAAVLPRTGSAAPVELLAGTGVTLLGLGALLVAATRRRSEV